MAMGLSLLGGLQTCVTLHDSLHDNLTGASSRPLFCCSADGNLVLSARPARRSSASGQRSDGASDRAPCHRVHGGHHGVQPEHRRQRLAGGSRVKGAEGRRCRRDARQWSCQ